MVTLENQIIKQHEGSFAAYFKRLNLEAGNKKSGKTKEEALLGASSFNKRFSENF
ncbi:hypothetical protein [Rufibacter sp. LB8]|uniref:hypothetical protein n=1 Tax=Rufibacter sp. LB8 TaxID=2777781 RepID=UPI00178C3A1C|nr:hypothetical protein [Rufibacter sp. LB8]